MPLTGVMLLAAGVLFARAPDVLTVTNTDRGRVVTLRMPSDGRFAVIYQHSMYGAPVTEEFSVGDDGAIVLTVLRSPSPAVLEYFGVTAAGDTHPMLAHLPAITMRIAMGAEQRLIIGAREYSFLEFGEHGDRVVLECRRTPSTRFQPSGENALE